MLQPLADDIPSLYSASRNKAASVAITKCFDREAPVSSEELALLRHDVCKMLDEARTDLEKTCTEVMTVTKGALERGFCVCFTFIIASSYFNRLFLLFNFSSVFCGSQTKSRKNAQEEAA